MSYKVLIAIKDVWWSDDQPLASFTKAQHHRKVVAAQWNDCDTAISAPDGRLLAFRESLQDQAKWAAVLQGHRDHPVRGEG